MNLEGIAILRDVELAVRKLLLEVVLYLAHGVPLYLLAYICRYVHKRHHVDIYNVAPADLRAVAGGKGRPDVKEAILGFVGGFSAVGSRGMQRVFTAVGFLEVVVDPVEDFFQFLIEFICPWVWHTVKILTLTR